MTQTHLLITKHCVSVALAVTAVLFAACGKDDSVDQVPGATKPPNIQTLEDLVGWEHEIPKASVDKLSNASRWGWLPSVAHGEKSLRDCCAKVLKIDPPEGITGMALLEAESMGEFKTAGVEFYLPEPGFEKFYTDFPPERNAQGKDGPLLARRGARHQAASGRLRFPLVGPLQDPPPRTSAHSATS